MNMSDRMIARAPTRELERRWELARMMMAHRGLDALVMQSSQDWLGGYVRWFTDIPATNGYLRTVIFSASGPMTIVEMGPFGGSRSLDGRDPLNRGVDTIVTTPSFSSIDFTHSYDAELTVKALQNASSIGWLGEGALPHKFVTVIKAQLGTGVSHFDATDEIDHLKAIKSADEMVMICAAAALQDEVFARVVDFIRPGLRDIDVTAYAQQQALVLGSEQGIFLGASAPVGVRSPFAPRWAQGRELARGDHLSLLIEVNGPGGFYTEIARTIVLGRASNALKSAFEAVKDAQVHSLSLMKPGVSSASIAAAHDDFMRRRGLPEELRLYAHGQGYDMVERPLIRRDETMPLDRDMCLAVHPGFETDELFAVICDNYFIGEDGPSPCLHKTEKRLFEV